MNYPEYLVRGISSEQYIDADGRASSTLFQFSDNVRNDGFSETQNNAQSNIVILCPNHHRIIHKYKAKFDYKNYEFGFKNNKKRPSKS